MSVTSGVSSSKRKYVVVECGELMTDLGVLFLNNIEIDDIVIVLIVSTSQLSSARQV